MEGTKPHQQLKEVSVEERYVPQRLLLPCVPFYTSLFIQLKLVLRNKTEVLEFTR